MPGSGVELSGGLFFCGFSSVLEAAKNIGDTLPVELLDAFGVELVPKGTRVAQSCRLSACVMEKRLSGTYAMVTGVILDKIDVMSFP